MTAPPPDGYGFNRGWAFEKAPIARNLSLSDGWHFTQEKVKALRAALRRAPPHPAVRVVAAAGSLGRMEASPASDADLIVVLHDGLDLHSEEARAAYQSVFAVCPDLGLEIPNPKGVFGAPCTQEQICGATVGKADEPLQVFGKRLLMLLETQPVLGDDDYDQVLTAIVARYATNYVAQDPKKEWAFLMNDLIRYFRSLCVNYQWDFEQDPAKWALRNVKLRHSRLIMFGGLLFLLGEASKEREDKVAWLKARLYLTPLERLAWVYLENRDYNFHRVASFYNSFLSKVSQPAVRRALAGGIYDDRLSNETYADLKASSDALVAELLRFVLARRNDWSERFFEYLIF